MVRSSEFRNLSFAASNAVEPPRKINNSMSPSSLSSLPNDALLEILARVPKRSYPILSCVSKNFRHLLRSSGIQEIRSRLRKDSLFICFDELVTQHWFTIRRDENNPGKNRVDSTNIAFPYQHDIDPCIIAIGPEIFFICGAYYPSSRMFIYDSRTGTLRQGPSSRADRLYRSVGLVGSKMYVIGRNGDDEMNVESFDVKTQAWEPAPVLDKDESWRWISFANVSLDRKVCRLQYRDPVVDCYDPRDGSWDSFDLPKDTWWRAGVCVIENVLYVYFARFGLMWYDSELKLWRLVNGLRDLDKVSNVAMAEYYGKLAFLWEESDGVSGETKMIWWRMIALDRREEGVHGTAETSQLLRSVPLGYILWYFLSVSE